MTRRAAWAVMVVTIVVGTIVVLSPAAQATKVLERYRSNTKELKGECSDGGGTYFGSSTGRIGICAWDDGTISTCDNAKKGKNCNTQGRVVTTDSGFLDFVEIAVADPSAVTVVTPDDTGASGVEQRGSPQGLIRRLLAKEDFAMTVNDLETRCTNVIEGDLIKRDDGSSAVCMGDSSVIYCDSGAARKNCTIEGTRKATRRMMQLLRLALVDPSSMTIIVAPRPGPPPTARPSSSTTEPPTTTTSTSPTATTTTTGPAFL